MYKIRGPKFSSYRGPKI